MVPPFHALVLFVHGGLRAHGVRWWAVVVVVFGIVLGVVVVVVVVVVVAGALVAMVVVVGLVVVLVLWACPQGPLAFWWGGGVGHRLQPLRLQRLVDSWGGTDLAVTAVEGSNVPESGGPTAVVVCGGWMMECWEMRMRTRVCTGLCCVAASVVAVCARGRGARDAVGAGSPLGFGLGFRVRVQPHQ